MKTRITLIFINFFLTFTTVYSQAYEPLELAKKIFSKQIFPNMEHYISGEYLGKPNGSDLKKGSITKFTLLGQSDQTAVVGMTILDSLGKGRDTYLHFEKTDKWKMIAFRGLAMTGMIEQMKLELEKMTPQQVDEMIEWSNKKDNSVVFESRDDYQFKLGNAKLILELDENIINHFLANQVAFERLKDLALSEIEKVEAEGSVKIIENSKAEYNKLFISSVYSGDYELGNCINFLIGGLLDNSVGYFYIKNKEDLPEMSSNTIIMIREIGNGWYLYKTT